MRKTTSKLAPATPALLLLLALSACAEGTSVDGLRSSGTRCAACHLSGAADAAGASGAHARHLTAGTLGGPFACSDCHVVPAEILVPGHDDGIVDLSFSARAGGASAHFDPAQKTCATACHGTASPVWTRVDGTQAQCGSCHALPPAQSTGHPPVASGCAACHPATVRADGAIDVAGGAHVNGQRDFAADACGACHGIPPTTGRHLLHVVDAQMSCNLCHPGTSSTDPGPGHRDGTVEVSVPGWTTTRSCAFVCHAPARW